MVSKWERFSLEALPLPSLDFCGCSLPRASPSGTISFVLDCGYFIFIHFPPHACKHADGGIGLL